MRVEFKTAYTEFENKKLSELYFKYCNDANVKGLKKFIIVSTVCVALASICAIFTDAAMVAGFALWYAFCLGYYFYTVKKLLPKKMAKVNRIICPSQITMGFYDEYFYEKCENNMQISEASIRYEFLKEVLETDEYFVILSKNHRAMLLQKRDIPPEAVMQLSGFFRARLPHIYKFR